jgi:hypothetical protein
MTLRAELRSYLTSRTVLLSVVVVTLGVVPGLLAYKKVEYVDRLSIANDFRYGILVFALPLLATVLVAFRTDSELRFGWIAYARARRSIRSYLLARLCVTSMVLFVIFATFALVSFAVAYYLVPAFGHPYLNPDDGNGMTEAQRFAWSLTSQPFASLLEPSPWLYGVTYAAWLGLSAAVYGALGIAAVLLIRRRLLALSLPLVVYIGETVVMQLAGHPQLSLMASAFPQGLSAFTTQDALAPMLALATVVGLLWIGILLSARRLEALS